MYKVITSFWSRATPPSKHRGSTDSHHDNEDGWVFISDAVMVSPSTKNQNIMTNSWIATPPLIKNDDSSVNVHHFNPIENLLIEHASMSVYDHISSKARNKRQKGAVNNNKLDEEEVDDDNDDQTSVDYQHSNSTSMHNQNSNSTATTLDASLIAHHRRLHHRRKRVMKSTLTSSTDDPKPFANKTVERCRLNHSRTPKVLLPQPSRCLH